VRGSTVWRASVSNYSHLIVPLSCFTTRSTFAMRWMLPMEDVSCAGFTAAQVLGVAEQFTYFVTQIIRLVHAARGIRNGLIPGFDQFLEALNVIGRLDLLD